ncbi:hypothetical protein MAIT1_00113 [Magnetofaba australis IT-1]|uniref:Uncharacterized protein n=2 Tax=Magnetofaba TaxID=1472292 RepID=A0A1Y2K8B5_9PROT|nr:hypothetical protein MAIT1_00113 [Magnetofaba australis IT-1]
MTPPPRPKRRFTLLPLWMRLGWVDYWRAFHCGRFACDGGGKDFSYLTLLLTLVISMALLLVSSHNGFLNRMTDALLGNIRPYGAPIWATAHWQNNDGIGRQVLDKLDAIGGEIPGVSTHPYRRLEVSRPRVVLPGAKSWRSKQPKFVGWAVYDKDPLWRLAVDPQPQQWGVRELSALLEELDIGAMLGLGDKPKQTKPATLRPQGPPPRQWKGLPLEVTLSKRLFAQMFDYDAYRQELSRVLRPAQMSDLPYSVSADELESKLTTLWLRMTVGREDHFFPFTVHWVDHIPAMEDVAYLFPLTTYHALMAAYHLPDLRFDPMNGGENRRGDLAMLKGDSYPLDELERYAACVNEAVARTGLTGVPVVSERECRLPRLPPEGARTIPTAMWDAMEHDNRNQLWLPCHKLAQDDPMRGALCSGWHEEDAKRVIMVPWDVTGYGSAFASVHVYVADPGNLSAVIERMTALRLDDQQLALNIHPKYQDALNRFNLLSDQLKIFIPAFAMAFGLLMIMLLAAQIGTLLGHRRHDFGMLLTRGVTWRGIHMKVYFQMTIATLISGSIATFGLLTAMRAWLGPDFIAVMERYRDLLNPGVGVEPLPLSALELALVWGGCYLAVLLVSALMLMKLPVRWGVTPSELLHGEGGVLKPTRY